MSALAMKHGRASRVETATARSQAYGLLASVFRAEPSREFIDELRGPRFAGALASLDVDFGRDFEKTSRETLCEDLGIEFTRLFMGPGQHISPHESIFVEVDGEAGGLYGAITVKVKKFIETTGLVYDDAFTGLPDHISVELEFMGRLAEFESEKWANGSSPKRQRNWQIRNFKSVSKNTHQNENETPKGEMVCLPTCKRLHGRKRNR